MVPLFDSPKGRDGVGKITSPALQPQWYAQERRAGEREKDRRASWSVWEGKGLCQMRAEQDPGLITIKVEHNQEQRGHHMAQKSKGSPKTSPLRIYTPPQNPSPSLSPSLFPAGGWASISVLPGRGEGRGRGGDLHNDNWIIKWGRHGEGGGGGRTGREINRRPKMTGVILKVVLPDIVSADTRQLHSIQLFLREILRNMERKYPFLLLSSDNLPHRFHGFNLVETRQAGG